MDIFSELVAFDLENDKLKYSEIESLKAEVKRLTSENVKLSHLIKLLHEGKATIEEKEDRTDWDWIQL